MSGNVSEKVKFWNSLESEDSDKSFATWKKRVANSMKLEAIPELDDSERIRKRSLNTVEEQTEMTSAQIGVHEGDIEEPAVVHDFLTDTADEEDSHPLNAPNIEAERRFGHARMTTEMETNVDETASVNRTNHEALKNDDRHADDESIKSGECHERENISSFGYENESKESCSQVRTIDEDASAESRISLESTESSSGRKTGSNVLEVGKIGSMNSVRHPIGVTLGADESKTTVDKGKNERYGNVNEAKEPIGQKDCELSACDRESSTSLESEHQKGAISDFGGSSALQFSPSKEDLSICKSYSQLGIQENQPEVVQNINKLESDEIQRISVIEVKKVDARESIEAQTASLDSKRSPSDENRPPDKSSLSTEPAKYVGGHTIVRRNWRPFGIFFVLALVVAWLIARYDVEIWPIGVWREKDTVVHD